MRQSMEEEPEDSTLTEEGGTDRHTFIQIIPLRFMSPTKTHKKA